jgi:hypothetical protein
MPWSGLTIRWAGFGPLGAVLETRRFMYVTAASSRGLKEQLVNEILKIAK